MSVCPLCGVDSADVFRPARGMHAGRLPARIVDLLEADGGWLTASGVADRLSANDESVHRALYRLKGRRLVVSRQVELALTSGGSKLDGYTEWRLA